MRNILPALLCLLSAGAITVVNGQSYTIGDKDGSNTTTSYTTPFGVYYKNQKAHNLARLRE